MSGLSIEVARLLEKAAQHLDRRDGAAAEPFLAGARALAPDHPEVLRLCGVAYVLAGRPGDAVAALRRALVSQPDDALLHNNLGSALSASGDFDGALAEFRRACELTPTLAAAWYNLGKTLKSLAHSRDADDALKRAITLAPRHVAARIVYADNIKALGRIDEAASAYRKALRLDANAVYAWWGLANLKTVRFDAGDVALLERCFTKPESSDGDRALVGFALGKALEDQDRYEDAFRVLSEANALRRRQQPWNAATFSSDIDAIADAFSASPHNRGPGDSRGNEVVFIVSLPRSGSTLIEQILAAHPDVEGAGELPDLKAVVDEESRLRGSAFPHWVKAATAADWQRLGERYLERTARWRAERPRFTDKSLLNWPYVGAAAAMLPGARFIDCRRDAVETALSCWRQWFSQGQAFSYAFDDIAAYLRDHHRLMRHWHDILPGALYEHVHERLLAEPEPSIRRLLEFCGLAFDPRCLESHRSERTVRTASAAQVREPLRNDAGRSARYGSLLDPLRAALEF